MVFAVELPAVFGEHRDDRLHGFFPTVALSTNLGAERVKLGRAGSFSQTKLDSTTREQVERGHTFGYSVRLIGWQLDDAVAETDVRCALAGRAKEHFGG